MKKIICIFIASIVTIASVAQVKVLEQEVKHYILDDFTKGFIYMKNGVINRGALNYNSVTEEMLFKDKGKIMSIGKDEIDLVDTVVIENKKFYPYNGKFLEVAYATGGRELMVEHKCRVIEPPKPSAYGTTTETASSKSYTNLTANGMFYSLEIPEGYRIVPYKYYWFKDGKKMTKIINIRQLEKLFKGEKERFKEYMEENKVSFNSVSDVNALVKHMLE